MAGSGALSAVPLQFGWPLPSEVSVQEIRTGVLCDEQESWPPDRSAALGNTIPLTIKSATQFPSLRDGAYGYAPLGTNAGRSAPRSDLAAPPEEAVRPLTRGIPALAHRAPAPNPCRSRLSRPRRTSPRQRPRPAPHAAPAPRPTAGRRPPTVPPHGPLAPALPVPRSDRVAPASCAGGRDSRDTAPPRPPCRRARAIRADEQIALNGAAVRAVDGDRITALYDAIHALLVANRNLLAAQFLSEESEEQGARQADRRLTIALRIPIGQAPQRFATLIHKDARTGDGRARDQGLGKAKRGKNLHAVGRKGQTAADSLSVG
jgi:hypothetical protein